MKEMCTYRKREVFGQYRSSQFEVRKSTELNMKTVSSMNDGKLIYGRSDSPCCSYPSIIVLSRKGGFVTQNCVKCGKPRSIVPKEFPMKKCSECHGEMSIFIVNKNYAYKCNRCGKTATVYSLVPSWEEKFKYHGYAILRADN